MGVLVLPLARASAPTNTEASRWLARAPRPFVIEGDSTVRGEGIAMPTTTQPCSTWTLAKRSATGTLNLSALGGVFTLAILSGHLGLVIAAGWLFVLLVARDVSSPRFARRLQARDEAARRQLPEASEVGDQNLRRIVSSIRVGYAEIGHVLEQTPEAIKAHLGGALASLQDLRVHAARLVRQCDELCGYLRAVPRAPVEGELARLKMALARADACARGEFEQAVAIREDQLAALDRIEREHDRTVAALERVVCTVEAFPSLVYRVRVLERRAREDVVHDVCEQLANVSGDVRATRLLLEGLADIPVQLGAGRGGEGPS